MKLDIIFPDQIISISHPICSDLATISRSLGHVQHKPTLAKTEDLVKGYLSQRSHPSHTADLVHTAECVCVCVCVCVHDKLYLQVVQQQHFHLIKLKSYQHFTIYTLVYKTSNMSIMGYISVNIHSKEINKSCLVQLLLKNEHSLFTSRLQTQVCFILPLFSPAK